MKRNKYNPMGLHIGKHGVLMDKWGRAFTRNEETFKKKRKTTRNSAVLSVDLVK